MASFKSMTTSQEVVFKYNIAIYNNTVSVTADESLS